MVKNNYFVVVSSSFFFQALFLLLVFFSVGFLRTFFFGFFWFFLIVGLISLLNRPSWLVVDWFSFSAFSVSIIFASFLAMGWFIDKVGVGVPVVGLLLVSSLLNFFSKSCSRKYSKKLVVSSKAASPKVPVPANKSSKRSPKSSAPSEELYFMTVRGTTYHRRSCGLINGKKVVPVTSSEVKAQGLNPCKRCF